MSRHFRPRFRGRSASRHGRCCTFYCRRLFWVRRKVVACLRVFAYQDPVETFTTPGRKKRPPQPFRIDRANSSLCMAKSKGWGGMLYSPIVLRGQSFSYPPLKPRGRLLMFRRRRRLLLMLNHDAATPFCCSLAFVWEATLAHGWGRSGRRGRGRKAQVDDVDDDLHHFIAEKALHYRFFMTDFPPFSQDWPFWPCRSVPADFCGCPLGRACALGIQPPVETGERASLGLPVLALPSRQSAY